MMFVGGKDIPERERIAERALQGISSISLKLIAEKPIMAQGERARGS
jgi:hypothetical protein